MKHKYETQFQIMFQYLIGGIQTEDSKMQTRGQEKFQYLIGGIQTELS